MPNLPWRTTRGARDARSDGTVVAVALHAGHELSPDVHARVRLSDDERRREEDPYTGFWTTVGDHTIVVDRSRFELDLNRPRSQCIYIEPADAWNLDVWTSVPPPALVERSRRLHDQFYAQHEALLADLARRHRWFLVLDLHSYNHRRAGPDAPPAEPAEAPEINLGTESIDAGRWGHVVAKLATELRRGHVHGRALDVRENVRFRGGYYPRWVNHHFGHAGCAVAVEVKKFFMDEWTGAVDWSLIGEIRSLFAAAVRGLMEAR
jgi:N-formylglutamate deformylase